MECEFNRLTNYSGHEHLIALMQPKKYSEDASRSIWMSAVLGFEEHGGLSDPGLRDCSYSILFLG
jgi:hypothetical protein